MARSANCGACSGTDSCGGGGAVNVCGCTSESDAVFCAANGKDCDSFSGVDNCGRSRSASCGSCSGTASCGGGGTANVCGCTAETDAAFCARLGVTCGQKSGTDNCGNPRTATCGAACVGCQAVRQVDPSGGIYYDSTSGSSTLSSSCGGASAPEVVYQWTPEVSGAATVSTCGSNFDTVLDIQNGTCGTGSTLACNDNSAVWCYQSTTHSLIDFSAVAGQTYFFTVDGAGSAQGNVTLKVVSAEGTCGNPFSMPTTGGTKRFAMNGGNSNVGSCGGGGTDRVVHWVAPKSGSATVSMSGDFWPAALYVRSGSCGGGSELGCNAQTAQWPTETITFNVSAGSDYYIWAANSSYTGDAVMYFDLTITPPP